MLFILDTHFSFSFQISRASANFPQFSYVKEKKEIYRLTHAPLRLGFRADRSSPRAREGRIIFIHDLIMAGYSFCSHKLKEYIKDKLYIDLE